MISYHISRYINGKLNVVSKIYLQRQNMQMKNVANMMLMMSKMTSPCIFPALNFEEKDENKGSYNNEIWMLLFVP